MGTHTFAELEVSEGAYDEIAQKLKDAGYEHAFIGETIDMHGIGLTKGQPIPKGQISDGYHTFDELYEHRCLLFLAFISQVHLATEPYTCCWKSKNHGVGNPPNERTEPVWEGWFLAGLTLGSPVLKSITYHLPMKYWELCKGIEKETPPLFDGHDSREVLTRLEVWLKG